MWIASKNGFFSIVENRNDSTQVLVRSRVKKDLQELFPETRILHTPHADYPWRVFAGKLELGDIMLNQLTDLDYPNFKGAISITPSQADKLEAYHKIWLIMHEYGHKKFDKKNIYQGCLVGGAIGDAMGSPVEFLSIQQIRNRYGSEGITSYVEFGDGSGEFTDDTQMTLFTAEGLLRAWHRFVQRGIGGAEDLIMYHSYLRWLYTQGDPLSNLHADEKRRILSGWLVNQEGLFVRKAPGNTCLAALSSGKQGTMDSPINDSKGCGTVMRMAPVGLVFSDTMELAFKMGCKFSAITHGHPSGYLSGGFFAAVISGLCQHIPLRQSIFNAIELNIGKPGCEELDRKVLQAVSLHDKLKGKELRPEDIEILGGGWVAEEALSISLLCSLHYPDNFEKGVLAAVNHSGDSDSTGSITGNILGLINGLERIPAAWVSGLRHSDLVFQLAEDLAIGVKGDTYKSDQDWMKKYPPN